MRWRWWFLATEAWVDGFTGVELIFTSLAVAFDRTSWRPAAAADAGVLVPVWRRDPARRCPSDVEDDASSDRHRCYPFRDLRYFGHVGHHRRRHHWMVSIFSLVPWI